MKYVFLKCPNDVLTIRDIFKNSRIRSTNTFDQLNFHFSGNSVTIVSYGRTIILSVENLLNIIALKILVECDKSSTDSEKRIINGLVEIFKEEGFTEINYKMLFEIYIKSKFELIIDAFGPDTITDCSFDTQYCGINLSCSIKK